MARPLLKSEMAPRWRMSPEERKRLDGHLEEWKKEHPSATLSQWFREAIELKMKLDREQAKLSAKALKRITK